MRIAPTAPEELRRLDAQTSKERARGPSTPRSNPYRSGPPHRSVCPVDACSYPAAPPFPVDMRSRTIALAVLITAVAVGPGSSWVPSRRPHPINRRHASGRHPAELDRPGERFMQNVADEPGVVHVALVATQERMELVEGITSDVYTFNGRVPGPTLELWKATG